MSDDRIHTLKEINLDAARYRWIAERPMRIAKLEDHCMQYASREELDAYIDAELALDN